MSEPSAPRSVVTGPPPTPATPADPYQPVRPYGEVELAPGSTVKYRNPVVVAVLTLVTLGIYTLVWWYLINRELADHGRVLGRPDLGEDPARSTLAMFPGAIVVVPAAWTMVTTFQRVQTAQRISRQLPINGWIGLVLGLVFSPALMAYLQSGLNSAWSAAAQNRR
jgi:hypothetical protein